MSAEQNKALVSRYVEEMANYWRTGDLSFVDGIFDSSFVQHISGLPPNMGREAMKQMFPMFRAGMPDFQMKIEDMVADGDRVAIRISWHGTHKGEIMGINPTGKKASITEMQFFRIANGKIMERWGESDMLGLMQQLGMIPGS